MKYKYRYICIADEIRQQRKRLGWTQQKLSDESGMARSQIADIETRRKVPQFATIEPILNAMGGEIKINWTVKKD